MSDTSAEGLVALLQESNHLVPWTDPEPPLEPEPDEFGEWMASLPLHPFKDEQ